jgi:trimeric autotransporter adhesin
MYATRTRTIQAVTATHWNGTAWSNGVPTAIKDAHIDADYSTFNGSFSCRNLIVTGISILTIETDTYVKVLRDINQDSTSKIHIKNEGNLMILDKNAATESAKVKVEASFPNHQRLDYEFISSPISGIPIKNLSPGTLDNRFYTYDEASNSYVSLNPYITLTNRATGYMIRVPSTFPIGLNNFNINLENVNSEGINSGVITKVITGLASGFNMIGNPYFAKVDQNLFYKINNKILEKSINFWKKTNGAQGSSYYFSNSFTNNIYLQPKMYIPNILGFLIQKKNPSITNNVIYTPEMMIINKNYTNPDRIYINIKQINIFHPIGGFCYDIKKFPLPFEDITGSGTIQIIDNGYKIICRKESFSLTDVIHIRVFFEIAANYTITVRDVCGLFSDLEHIYLIDQLLNVTQNLKLSDYNFSSEAGEFLNRFKIVFQL